jgi:osmotically-inducible protein OsmY
VAFLKHVTKEIEMSRPNSTRVLSFVVILMSSLSGCATLEKCQPGGCPGDAKITAKVQERLSQYPDIDPANSISVQTLNHVVYLNGLVAYGIAKENAESQARQVPGVTQVVNNIAVEH